jgi:hypothetical protein
MLKRVGDFLSRPLPAGSLARSLLPSQSTLNDGIAERIDEDRGKVLEERKRRRELAIKNSDVSLEKLESPLAMLPPTLTRLDGYSKTGMRKSSVRFLFHFFFFCSSRIMDRATQNHILLILFLPCAVRDCSDYPSNYVP